MRLEENHEVVGVLSKVKSNEQHIKLDFTIHKTYEIPIDAISEKALQDMVGARVGVFNCNGDYRVRRANKK